VDGQLSSAEIVAAGDANRALPDEQQLLDALVRDAIGPGRHSGADTAGLRSQPLERMRQSLLSLRGRRDSLRLDPADPAAALAKVIAEAAAHFDFGPRRGRLLEQIGVAEPPPGQPHRPT